MNTLPHEAQAAYDMATTGVYKGFTHQALSTTFDTLAPPNDWRGSIDVWVPGDLVMIAVAAIQFFTATTPTVTLDQSTMHYRITSIGYRQGPAGDH